MKSTTIDTTSTTNIFTETAGLQSRRSNSIVVSIREKGSLSRNQLKRFKSIPKAGSKCTETLVNHPVSQKLIMKLALKLSTCPSKGTTLLLSRIFDELAVAENFEKIRERLFFEVISEFFKT